MAEFVLLHHILPDGSWHHDWLIEHPSPPNPARPLLSFRTHGRADLGEEFEAEQIVDHRAKYLRFEGALAGGRGMVRRIAGGRAHVLELTHDRLVVDLEVAGGRVRMEGRIIADRVWHFCGSVHKLPD